MWTYSNSAGVFFQPGSKVMALYISKSFNVFLYLLRVRYSEVHVGSNIFGRNVLKREINTKSFVFRLILYGFVRPE